MSQIGGILIGGGAGGLVGWILGTAVSANFISALHPESVPTESETGQSRIKLFNTIRYGALVFGAYKGMQPLGVSVAARWTSTAALAALSTFRVATSAEIRLYP